MIPLARPSITNEDIQVVTDVLRSGHLVQGKKVQEFEEAIAAYVGTRYAVAVSSGTAALHLALLSIGIRQGDFVIVPAYSFPATANVVRLCGAIPVFCDIDQVTFNINVNALHNLLIKHRYKVKAIMPVHCFGLMAEMDDILSLVMRYEISVVEDAACALGSSLDGKRSGSWGAVGCFSFHPLKLITTGEGGMMTTDSDILASLARTDRDHGRADGEFKFQGFNYRMTEFQAALGLSQFKRLGRIIYKRKRLAEDYDSLLRDIATPQVPLGHKWNYQSYVVKVNKRDHIRKTMLDKGIETSIGTHNIPRTLAYRYLEPCHATDAVASRSLGLPMYEGLTREDQAYVAKTLLEAVNG